MVVNIVWGAAGTGKTRAAIESMGPDETFILDPPMNQSGGVWWDGYTGQKSIVIDDFYGWVPHNALLRFTDKNKCQVQIKGGMVRAEWEEVWITSNKHPKYWYQKSFPWDDDDALKRRIDHIWEVKKIGNSYQWEDEKTGERRLYGEDFTVKADFFNLL